MMGTVLLLLVVPLVIFVLGEIFERVSWTPFGLFVDRTRRAPPARPEQSAGRIVRQPDLPPRLALHERSRERIVVRTTGPGGEPSRTILHA